MNAYYDISAFKVYINDIGLLRRKAKLSSSIIKSNNFYDEFKGALTENFVFSHLLNHFDNSTCYYTFDNYEIDFLIQYKNEIIPIEVKSSTNINSISLKKYKEKFNPKVLVRFSQNNFKLDDNILNVPLYMVE